VGGQLCQKRKPACAKVERTAQSIARAVTKVSAQGGGESHSESESSEVDEDEEGEIIFARSPLHEYLPSPGDLFGRRLGAPASAHRAECPS
jgi:hypothetical protein